MADLTREQELAWEKRFAPQAAAAAFAVLLLGLGSTLYITSSLKDPPADSAERVAGYALHPNVYIVSSIIQGLSFLALALALLYFDRAIRFRRPETPSFVRVITVVGAVFVAGATIAGVVYWTKHADSVLPLPGKTSVANKAADDFLGKLPDYLLGFNVAGSIALGFGIAFTGINAIRAGLLSRFMGYLGVALGIFTGLGAIGGGVLAGGPLLLFWSAALGFLILGRWPGKRGPAWDKGEAIPWPSQTQRMQEAQARGEGRQADRQARRSGGPPPAAAPSEAVESADPDTPRPRSRKRKKRR
jgi:hypothetical protein